LVPGKRYAVFAIKTVKGQTLWIRAGVAYVQPDDSMNLTLDVLPIDGTLHVREIAPKQAMAAPKEILASAASAELSMGGH
jgi:hypothetical protein